MQPEPGRSQDLLDLTGVRHERTRYDLEEQSRGKQEHTGRLVLKTPLENEVDRCQGERQEREGLPNVATGTCA